MNIATALICVVCMTADGAPRFRDAYSLNYTGVIKGSAELVASPTRLKAGEEVELRLTYVNEGMGHWFFNPFFSNFVPHPAMIAVFDSDKRYVGSGLTEDLGSKTTVGSQNWAYLPTEGTAVGTTFRVRAGRLPGVDETLPPGKYYLQVIFFNSFIGLSRHANRHNIGPQDGQLVVETFDRDELFRSNIVEVELLAASSAPTSAPAR